MEKRTKRKLIIFGGVSIVILLALFLFYIYSSIGDKQNKGVSTVRIECGRIGE